MSEQAVNVDGFLIENDLESQPEVFLVVGPSRVTKVHERYTSASGAGKARMSGPRNSGGQTGSLSALPE